MSAVLAACTRAPREALATDARRVAGETYVVHDTVISTTFDAAGVAEPLRQASLSTKLMGTVTEVLVAEGDGVSAGQPLVRIDARDLAAKEMQLAASIAEAEAVHRDAETQATRMRALYADSAATRAQLDAAETGLARAEAGVRSARAAADELT
ncbi:MAG: efflux RND transporter periplasmic adaptor subunit, partial [Gemmatimonadaceae bacterium]